MNVAERRRAAPASTDRGDRREVALQGAGVRAPAGPLVEVPDDRRATSSSLEP